MAESKDRYPVYESEPISFPKYKGGSNFNPECYMGKEKPQRNLIKREKANFEIPDDKLHTREVLASFDKFMDEETKKLKENPPTYKPKDQFSFGLNIERPVVQTTKIDLPYGDTSKDPFIIDGFWVENGKFTPLEEILGKKHDALKPYSPPTDKTWDPSK